MEPGLYQILFISAGLFFIGVYGFFTRRNLITMLMSVELILNSVNLNFIAFNKYLWPNRMDGLFFTVFIVAIAAAEAIGGELSFRDGQAPLLANPLIQRTEDAQFLNKIDINDLGRRIDRVNG